MNLFDQVRPIMRSGERYIIVEQGRPQYVLLSFSDYTLLLGGSTGEAGAARPSGFSRSELDQLDAELEESLPRELDFRTEVVPGEPAAVDPSRVRLEDLPL